MMASFQNQTGKLSSVLLETSCGFLLQELQMIWDEVGEDQFEREKVLIDLEQECIHVYRRKVDAASISRARLHQELAEAEAEFTHLLLSLGERSLPGRPDKLGGTLKEQLDSITPALREMRTRKEERVTKFKAVHGEIRKISAEIAGQSDNTSSVIPVNENDISLKKLEEYEIELQRLQNEKNERLRRVEKYIGTIHDLSTILGKDSSDLMTLVHRSLNELGGSPKNISDVVLEKLGITVESLLEEKQKRLEKLHRLGKSLINLWNLMDSPDEDRRLFSHATNLLSLSTAEVSDPGSLTIDIIEQAEAEVKRLDQLKASKMKELFQRKQIDLEKVCRDSHMEIPSRAEMEKIMNLINSGEIDYTDLLMSMDDQIRRAKEEASSRRPIMEKVEKWMSARNEELWLEEYSRDENRYSVSRGAHKNLMRAERGRIMVSKISALVDSLVASTKGWEEERKKVFYYDEVPLLAMLEEYNMFRQIKEGEKQKQRERKKIQSLTVINQENSYTSRPGTSSRRIPDRSLNVSLSNPAAQRRISVAIHQLESNSINSASPSMFYKREARKGTFPRPSHLALRDETASVVSTFSGPISP